MCFVSLLAGPLLYNCSSFTCISAASCVCRLHSIFPSSYVSRISLLLESAGPCTYDLGNSELTITFLFEELIFSFYTSVCFCVLKNDTQKSKVFRSKRDPRFAAKCLLWSSSIRGLRRTHMMRIAYGSFVCNYLDSLYFTKHAISNANCTALIYNNCRSNIILLENAEHWRAAWCHTETSNRCMAPGTMSRGCWGEARWQHDAEPAYCKVLSWLICRQYLILVHHLMSQ